MRSERRTNSVKTRLEGFLLAQKDLNNILEEMERAHAQRTRITTVIREVTSGGSGGFAADSRAEATARLVELEKQLYAKVTEYTALSEALHAEINTLKSEKQRTVLRERYILGWSWKHIADDMGMEMNNLFHMHGRALIELDKNYREHERA